MIDRHQFRQEMNETAALAADDPRRMALERRVAEEQEWAAAQWRGLLLENECLRTELPKVTVPADLQCRMLAVSNGARRLRVPVGWRTALVAAAVVLAVLAGGLFRRHTIDTRMRTVTLLAINNHLNHLGDHGVSVETSEPRKLETMLNREVPFDVLLPEMGGGLQLVGGRKCKLGTHTVAFSLWHGTDGEYSLFQFQTEDFGVPHAIAPTLVRSNEPAGTEHKCGAWIWAEDKHGYVLVGDPENNLEQLSPGSQGQFDN